MRKYEAPELFVDEYVADTTIASATGGETAKNHNAPNNQNCWGCKSTAGELDPGNPNNACSYLPNTPAYDAFC